MENVNCIVFVAEMKNPNTNASSTQIMTSNLFYGFRSICKHFVFLPVVADRSDDEEIRQYYSGSCDDIIFVKQKTTFENRLLLRQLSMYKETMLPTHYSLPSRLFSYLKRDSVLISQSPTIDTIMVCRQIKRENPQVRYIQYWGDPMALTGITIEEYSFKRALLKRIEKKTHTYADTVVYGTDSLYREQMKLYPSIAWKAKNCDVAFNPRVHDANNENNNAVCGYFGNYYSKYRNIIPLYRAFERIPNCKLVICGSSDLILSNTENVIVKDRIPLSHVETEESKTNIEICLLNRVSAQIPGKVFYHTNTSKPIIVILDGPRAQEIQKELAKSKRFHFCENNEESIISTINSVIDSSNDISKEAREYYSPEKVCRQIIQ